jgi:hypothetical protein
MYKWPQTHTDGKNKEKRGKRRRGRRRKEKNLRFSQGRGGLAVARGILDNIVNK